MIRSRRCVYTLFGSALVLAMVSLTFAQSPKCSSTANGMSCRIDQPTVTKSSTQYPTVRFNAGDKVTIKAGGCVQTGGSGRTWKRYVNPSGPNSDHLYHGLIDIPGITPGGKLARIGGYLDRQLTIPAGVNNVALVLGYEDDDYSDNGYWGHDDGTENQCRNVGPAWVTVQIIHGTTTGGTGQNKPMDLVFSSGMDYNGIPLNPRWYWETTHADHPNPVQLCGGMHDNAPLGNPPCTGQYTWLNTPDGFNSFICSFEGNSIHGHVNWSPATIQGKLHWGDHSSGDDDYDWELWPANKSGLTTANPDTIHLEFDSDETVDNISSGWWNQFHQAVDNGDTQARQMIGDTGTDAGGAHPDAIVIGLMGLDAEHDAHSELHPVFGMAIHVKDDPADDTWAILSRNWGDEGFCATDAKETLEIDSLSFLIPRSNVSAVNTREASFFSNNSGTTYSVNRIAGGALVTFNMGATSRGTLISGLLRLSWTTSASAPQPSGAAQLVNVSMAAQTRASQPGASPFGHAGPVAKVQAQTKNEAEGHVNTLAQQLSPEKRVQFRKLAMAPRFELKYPVQQVQRPVPAKRTQVPKVNRVADPRKKQRSLLRARLLCEAHGGKVPGVPPSACTQAMQQTGAGGAVTKPNAGTAGANKVTKTPGKVTTGPAQQPK